MQENLEINDTTKNTKTDLTQKRCESIGKRKMIIYKTINLINGKFYVGKDTHNNPKYLGSGVLLDLAIKKYGVENFKKEIIESCHSLDRLNKREIYWIKKLKSRERGVGYNISSGGDGGDVYTNNPRKKEISKKLKKSYHQFTKHHPNFINRGKKISESKKGCIFTKEHLKNLSISHIGQIAWNKGKKFPGSVPTGKNHWCYGTHTSEKQKQAVRKANAKRDYKKVFSKYTEENNKMYIKINNDIKQLINKMFKKIGSTYIWKILNEFKLIPISLSNLNEKIRVQWKFPIKTNRRSAPNLRFPISLNDLTNFNLSLYPKIIDCVFQKWIENPKLSKNEAIEIAQSIYKR